jgi:hypothetical protein
MNETLSLAHKLLQEKVPSISAELLPEILNVIDILQEQKKKKKKEINNEERLIAWKKKALNYINANYINNIIIKEAEGYYIVAHSKKIKAFLEHVKNIFQPMETTKEYDFGCLTIIKYDKMYNKDIKPFLDINCEVIYID